MIPVQLTIQGLYSYRSKQVIDFQKLISAQLFGIFGGVGSGKSSILEAISFALYYQSERLNKQDNRSYNMMNLKSDEFLIDFIFTAGADQQEYRIKIETSRKKNKDEVKPFVRSTYQKVNGDWVATELDIDQLVGLSYDNFKRTIIIPQGKFQDFLELPDSKRIEMLKDVFQLEKFELSNQVSVLISDNKQATENLKGQMLSLEHVSPEAIQNVADQKSITGNQFRLLNEKLQAARKSLQQQEKLKELHDLLVTKQNLYNVLSEQEPLINQKETRLQQYQKICRLFQFDFANLKQLQVQQSEVQKKISLGKHNLEALEHKHIQAAGDFEKIKSDYDNRESQLRKAEEMEIYLQARQIQEQLKIRQIEEADSRNEIKLLQGKLTQSEQNEEVLKEQLSASNQNFTQKDVLYQVKAWFEQEKSFVKNVNERVSEKEQNENTCLELKKALQYNLLQADLGWKNVEELPDNYEKFASHIGQQVADFQKQLEEYQAQIAKINAHVKLEAYAQALQDGEPCPLCGSEHHPNKLESQENQDKLIAVQEKISQIDTKIKFLSELQLKYSREFQQIDSANQKLIEAQDKLQIAQSDYESFKLKFAWPAYSQHTLDEVSAELQNLLTIEKQEREIADGIEKLRVQQKDLRLTLEQKQNLFHKLVQENSSLVTRVDTLFQSLKNLKVEKAEAMSISLLQSKAQEIKTWYHTIGQQYKAAEANLATLSNEISLRKGEIAVQMQHIEELTHAFNLLKKTITDKLAQEKILHEEVEKLLAASIDEEKLQKEIAEFRQNLFAAKEAILELEKQNNGQVFESEQYNHLVSQVGELEKEFKDCHESLVRLEKELSDLQSLLLRKEELQNQLDALNLRAENLRTLSSLFRSSGFVNYISSKFLINLCNAANDKFYKLTRQQLRLEISENNDFQVRDFLNNGKVRSVKTLSGGQTFQASLCLALALADSVQQQNKSRQNFFFLDEGFGSQDKDSLLLVFEALKALRKENRIVGIISHVEELQHEIQTFLTVRNTEEEGSVVC